jgi:hypothetical protein
LRSELIERLRYGRGLGIPHSESERGTFEECNR